MQLSSNCQFVITSSLYGHNFFFEAVVSVANNECFGRTGQVVNVGPGAPVRLGRLSREGFGSFAGHSQCVRESSPRASFERGW